jgi:prepilin-type N-terminal cleavage/methylation domain-containing protein
MKFYRLKARRCGFTLIELITVVTIIVLLFSLVVGGFTFADRFSKRSKSEVTIKAVRSALENYKEDFGGYPEVALPDTSIEIAQKVYIVGGGACLYQAMSGDGIDQIKGATGGGVPESDGNLDDNETKNVKMADMPNELWAKTDGLYYIIDGFGHPLRYIKSAPTQSAIPGGAPPDATTVNQGTYDIWSYADDEENLTATSLDSLTGSIQAASKKWIRNW